MPKSIVELSKKILGEFEQVTIKPQQATAEKVEQGVYFVSKGNKVSLLTELIKDRPGESVLVFSRTKHGANKIVKKLDQADIKSAAIHGNKSQPQREAALGGFKDGKIQVLIATDIAARGIDVDDLALVINYDLPNVAETYVHRIGRTGRAHASGMALSFCENEERPYLKDIEKLIKQEVPRMDPHPEVEEEAYDASAAKKPKQQQRGRGGGGGRKPQGKSQNKGGGNRRR
jgi:ATP-dependent RNA helicase RhlE